MIVRTTLLTLSLATAGCDAPDPDADERKLFERVGLGSVYDACKTVDREAKPQPRKKWPLGPGASHFQNCMEVVIEADRENPLYEERCKAIGWRVQDIGAPEDSYMKCHSIPGF